MKLLVDLFPVFLFFVAYKLYGLYVATSVAVIVALLQLATIFYLKRTVDKMLLLSTLIIILLGTATLIFHNDMFIKWKPTVINWAFGLVFLISQFTSNKSLMQRLMEQTITLPKTIWLRLNTSWVIFFALLGALNLYVVYHFSTDIWVNFKLFGILGLTLLFLLLQMAYLSHYTKGHSSHGAS